MPPSAHLGLSGLQELWLVGCAAGWVLLMAVGGEDCVLMGEKRPCQDPCNSRSVLFAPNNTCHLEPATEAMDEGSVNSFASRCEIK